jgi:hypothetical protein
VVECQLPKLDVAGSSPVSRSKINNLQTALKHTLHSPPLRITRSLSRPNSLGENQVLKLLRGGRPILHTRLGVDIESQTDAMAAMVCGHLRIHFGFVAKARMRPPHHLEIHPAQTDRFQLGPDMILKQQRPPARLTCLTRKHVGFGILVRGLLHPIAEQRGSRGRIAIVRTKPFFGAANFPRYTRRRISITEASGLTCSR